MERQEQPGAVKEWVKCFKDFIQTLDYWWNEILNNFVVRETSGFIEGFNNKLKVLMVCLTTISGSTTEIPKEP